MNAFESNLTNLILLYMLCYIIIYKIAVGTNCKTISIFYFTIDQTLEKRKLILILLTLLIIQQYNYMYVPTVYNISATSLTLRNFQ